MAEITRQDLKEVFTESLEPFTKAVQEDFKSVNARLDIIDERLSSVETDVRWMKDNSGELFTKLNRLIALFEKNEQEILMLSAQLKRLEERVNKLESQQG